MLGIGVPFVTDKHFKIIFLNIKIIKQRIWTLRFKTSFANVYGPTDDEEEEKGRIVLRIIKNPWLHINKWYKPYVRLFKNRINISAA